MRAKTKNRIIGLTAIVLVASMMFTGILAALIVQEFRVKLVSWNVNGLRACIRKGFLDFVAQCQTDVICLQEVKAYEYQVDIDLPGYEIYWNSAQRAGYSGTAILTKIKPLSVHRGLADIEDVEGRVLILEFENFYLVNVYTPNSKRQLERLEYRKLWDAAFKEYMEILEESKPVVACGDFNVAHNEIDIARPASNHWSAGFTDVERQGFTNLLEDQFVDSFRFQHPGETNRYSWWSPMGTARERNVGWRLDYFVVSNKLKEDIKDTDIFDQVYSSDHCPVYLRLFD